MTTAPAPTPAATGPLKGIRVLDLTSVVLGPLATQTLADFGADVIKIEPPEGDLMRANGVALHPGMGSIFLAINRNKRSVCLDLKTAPGRAALDALIPGADVLVHNMRLPAARKLGLDYARVASLRPDIVYCAALGFGQDGPHSGKPAFDDIIQAGCGLLGLSLGSPGAQPGYVPSLIADKTCALAVCNAIMAALLHRAASGQGQYIEVPMLETMAAFVMAEHMGGLTFRGSQIKAGYHRLLHGGRQPAPTQDGWIAIMPYTGKHWRAFFDSVGRAELIQRYDVDDRHQLNAHVRELYAHLRAATRQKTTAQWMTLCEQLDIPATPIYLPDELPTHPHLQAAGLFQDAQHPTEGPIRQLRPTTRFSATPANIYRQAPATGQHTHEVLRAAGLSEGQIARLGESAATRGRKIFRTAADTRYG